MKLRPSDRWLALALALASACSPDEPTEQAPDDARASLERPATTAPAATSSAARDATHGGDARRVTLQARDTRRSALLARLAELAGFQLVGAPRDDRVMSIDREGAPLEQVLSELLVGEPYSMRYGVDEQSGAHRLQRVSLGGLKNELARLRREDRMQRRSRAAQQRVEERRQQRALERALTPEQREQARAQRAAERAQREIEIASALDAPDTETRARGVAKLDPDDEESLRQLLELSGDAEPAVRASAVSRLALSDAHGAREALANALQDPDPRVVIEALDAIAFQHDPTAAALVAPLVDHPDEDVRNAAADTLSFIE